MTSDGMSIDWVGLSDGDFRREIGLGGVRGGNSGVRFDLVYLDASRCPPSGAGAAVIDNSASDLRIIGFSFIPWDEVVSYEHLPLLDLVRLSRFYLSGRPYTNTMHSFNHSRPNLAIPQMNQRE